MDDDIKVNIVEPEPIVLNVSDGVIQELYVADGKLGIALYIKQRRKLIWRL